jgi:hypothetical protein
VRSEEHLYQRGSKTQVAKEYYIMMGFITCILQKISKVRSMWVRQEDVWDMWVRLQILTKFCSELWQKRGLFEDLDAGLRGKSEINIKKNLKRVVERIIFAQERHPCWKFVNMATVFGISQNRENFLNN